MKKSQKREWEFKGAITAFLALIFTLLISLVGALVESASIQMTKNRRRADVSLALESIFAEYDAELLEQYDIFARKVCDKTELQRRMEYYGADQVEHSTVKKELLTDDSGINFFEQAVLCAKSRLGIDATLPHTDYEFYSENYLEEEDLVNMRMEELLQQDEQDLPEEGNPLSSVKRLKETGLLTLICENPETLSERSLTVDNLPSNRELKTGNWERETLRTKRDRQFFAAYLKEHFGSYADTREAGTLLYEEEYLIGGKASDRENLEVTCKWILSLRMATNYAYLLTDTVKQAEAEAMALSLCSLLTVPGIAGVVKHALLLAWAYGESIVDMRVLMKGKKVPAIKSADTWQLQLANLLTLGTADETVSEIESAGGLSYQSYLTVLLSLGYQWTLSMRSLDLIENHLHIGTDEYMTKLEIQSKATLRRGVKDSFTTSFGYE